MKITSYFPNIHQNIFERAKILTREFSNNISKLIISIQNSGMSFKKSLSSIVVLGATTAYVGPMALAAATTAFVAYRIITPIFAAKSNIVKKNPLSNPETSYYENLSTTQSKEQNLINLKPVTTNAQNAAIDQADRPLKSNYAQQSYTPALLLLAKQQTIFQNNILTLRNKKDKKSTSTPDRKNISATTINPNENKPTKEELSSKEKAIASVTAGAIAYFMNKHSTTANVALEEKSSNTNDPNIKADNKPSKPSDSLMVYTPEAIVQKDSQDEIKNKKPLISTLFSKNDLFNYLFTKVNFLTEFSKKTDTLILLPTIQQTSGEQKVAQTTLETVQKTATSKRSTTKKPKTVDSKIHLAMKKILHKKTPITISTKKRAIKALSQCPTSELRNEAIKVIKAHRSNKKILQNLRNSYLKHQIPKILESNKKDHEKIREIRKEIERQPKSRLKTEIQESITKKLSPEKLIQLVKTQISLVRTIPV